MKIQAVAPTRLSLFGGGTDVDPYASKYGGLVINMAINLRQKTTLYTDDDLYELTGPNIIPYLGKQEFNYAILDEFGMDDMHQVKLKSEFDAILESGLGSSASAAVALIGAINKYKNLNMSLDEIAEKAWEIEVKKMGLFGGKQDQYASVYGGVNAMQFEKDTVQVTPLARGFIKPLLPSLVLFYIGKNRKSAKIQEGFKQLDKDQIWALDNIKRIALNAIDPIGKGDFRRVGALLDDVWEFKKLSNKGVTNTFINQIYNRAKSLGSYGGKVLGAGGGGFILFVVDPTQKERFIRDMKIEWYDFSPCWNGLEVRVL